MTDKLTPPPRLHSCALDAETWCVEPACCNPPGYHYGDPPTCPDCGSDKTFTPRDAKRSQVACFRCDRVWTPVGVARGSK